MSTYYQQLVDRYGEDEAKARMRELRAKVKKPGFSSMETDRVKEIASLGGKAQRKHEKISPTETQQDTTSQA